MSIDSSSSIKFNWFNEGIILAVAPAVAYYLVFTYESAYCRYFGIPDIFIKPDLTTILVYVAIIWSALFVLIPLFDIAADMATDSTSLSDNIYVRLLQSFAPLLVLFGFLISIYWHRWKIMIPTIIIMSILFTLDIALTFVTRDKSKPFAGQLNTGTVLFFNKGSFLHTFKSRYGAKATKLAILVILGIFISRSMGQAAAMNQEIFLVLSNSSDVVVLRQYGDKMICANFDINKKSIKKSFHIIIFGSDPKALFEQKSIGPLQP